ncbi:hypothetical protein DUNSADRAFT_10250, partial [Dunaliella salina]
EEGEWEEEEEWEQEEEDMEDNGCNWESYEDPVQALVEMIEEEVYDMGVPDWYFQAQAPFAKAAQSDLLAIQVLRDQYFPGQAEPNIQALAAAAVAAAAPALSSLSATAAGASAAKSVRAPSTCPTAAGLAAALLEAASEYSSCSFASASSCDPECKRDGLSLAAQRRRKQLQEQGQLALSSHFLTIPDSAISGTALVGLAAGAAFMELKLDSEERAKMAALTQLHLGTPGMTRGMNCMLMWAMQELQQSLTRATLAAACDMPSEPSAEPFADPSADPSAKPSAETSAAVAMGSKPDDDVLTQSDAVLCASSSCKTNNTKGSDQQQQQQQQQQLQEACSLSLTDSALTLWVLTRTGVDVQAGYVASALQQLEEIKDAAMAKPGAWSSQQLLVLLGVALQLRSSVAAQMRMRDREIDELYTELCKLSTDSPA